MKNVLDHVDVEANYKARLLAERAKDKTRWKAERIAGEAEYKANCDWLREALQGQWDVSWSSLQGTQS